MALLNFDSTNVDPNQKQEPIAAGWYNVMITESEMKPTADKTGAYLNLGNKILDGQFAGRMVFDNLNIQNANVVAQEIAYRRLSGYCHATGVIQVADSQQLHGIPFKIRVSIKPAKDDYEARNDVKEVQRIDYVPASSASAHSTGQAPIASHAPMGTGFGAAANPAPMTGSNPGFAPAAASPPAWQQTAANPPVANNAVPLGGNVGSTPPWNNNATVNPAPVYQTPATNAPVAGAGTPPPWARQG